MQIKYTLDDGDFFEFQKYHLFNSNANKNAIIFQQLRFPFIYLIFIVFILMINNKLNDLVLLSASFIILFIFSVIWVLSVKRMLVRALKVKIKRMRTDGKLPYCRDITITLEDEYIKKVTEWGESRYKYASVEKMAVSGDFAYIYINAVQALIIPLRVFENEERKKEFLNLIHEKRRYRYAHEK